MKTKIKTIHEEAYSDGSRTLGMLLNYSEDPEAPFMFKESFVYMYRKTEEGGRYVFFNTMFDLFSSILYGEDKMKRAYMDETDFDTFYDSKYINGAFNEHLVWV